MNLYYGSSGDSVRQLQTSLNRFGYGLDVDGGFGPKTEAAVRDYQTRNNLQVDGVVGSETWSSLSNDAGRVAPPQTGAAVLSGVSQETADALAGLEKGGAPSAETETARANYDSISAAKPKDFTSQTTAQLQKLYREMEKREPFSYDPGHDTVFQEYAGQYTRRGQQAMTDTVGKAAALSGGYASTYAQTAGQQAYQSYLQQLYDLLPQLSEDARDAYDREGEALAERYSLLQKQEEQSYDRWRDTVSDWDAEKQQAYREYESARSGDDDRYKLLLNYYADKAAAEEKAAPEGAVNNSGTARSTVRGQVLSSVAYGSLSHAMGNYLKAGGYQSAAALYRQYQGRMNAGQKAEAAALFRRYGRSV